MRFYFSEKFSFDTFSGVLQSLLLVTSKVGGASDDCPQLCKFLSKKMIPAFEEVVPPIKVGNDDDVTVSTIFREDAPCRVLETMMEVSAEFAPKIFKKIGAKLFEGRIATLSVLPLANFSVQKLLNFCKSKEQVSQS